MDKLVTIKCIKKKTATALLAHGAELGKLNRGQIASLAGLAPVTCESGTMKKQSKIRGGRTELRRALYMSAQVAARFCPVLNPFYERLVNKGKPKKVAIVAVMRKLLLFANQSLKGIED